MISCALTCPRCNAPAAFFAEVALCALCTAEQTQVTGGLSHVGTHTLPGSWKRSLEMTGHVAKSLQQRTGNKDMSRELRRSKLRPPTYLAYLADS